MMAILVDKECAADENVQGYVICIGSFIDTNISHAASFWLSYGNPFDIGKPKNSPKDLPHAEWDTEEMIAIS